MQYGQNAFVTLTYASDEQVTLDPAHARDFLKRIRRSIEPVKIRFYLVGEYGDKSERPHYHVALFNYPCCTHGLTQYNRNGIKCCDTCKTIQLLWGYGNIYVGSLEPHSAAYIAGYVTKKMTRYDDIRLNNRHPEFARMSLKPGIGHDAMWDYASVLLQYAENHVDVPNSLRHGGKPLPLGRYLTRTARRMMGRKEETPLETIQKSQEKLLSLQETALASASGYGSTEIRKMVYKNLILDKFEGNRRNVEARYKLYGKKKGSL